MYTLLVGKPPFETNSLKETYSRIRKNEYIIPEDRVGQAASDLIIDILQGHPEKRPKVKEILQHDFIRIGKNYKKSIFASFNHYDHRIKMISRSFFWDPLENVIL